MPVTLPGINELPALTSISANQFSERRQSSFSHPHVPTGLESYRSSVSSSSDVESYRHPSTSSSISTMFENRLSLLSQQDTVSSPIDSVGTHSVSLPPISSLMSAPRSESLSSPGHNQALSSMNRTLSQGHIQTIKEEMSSPPQQAVCNHQPPPPPPHHQQQFTHAVLPQPSNYGYTTQAGVSPTTSFPPPQQHQHQQAYYSHAPQNYQPYTVTHTPRSQDSSIVYVPVTQYFPTYSSRSSRTSISRRKGDSPKREVKRRTRTGCLTCRRRRIKCDERKPGCHNCEKSKICCAGYQSVQPTKGELKKMNKVMKVDAILG